MYVTVTRKRRIKENNLERLTAFELLLPSICHLKNVYFAMTDVTF